MISPRLFCAIALLLCSQAQGQGAKQAEDLHFQRAVDLLRQQQFAAALPQLEQSHRAHPNVPEIENLLGITETQLGQLQAADVHYLKAITLNPKLAGPHKNLGFNDLNEKAYAAAERELKTALSLDPRDPFTHYYLAILYLATSRETDAVEQLEPSQTLLANDPANEFLMAKACLNTGHTAQVLALIKTLDEKSQLTLQQNYELAVLLTSKQLYPEAVGRFEAAVAGQPQSQSQLWIAKYDLALAYLNASQRDKALGLLQTLAAEQPDNPAVLSSLGSAYESAEQLPQALDAYKRAVRADPQNPDRYLDYTRLLMELDRNEEATQIIEQAIPGTQDAYALDIRLGVLRMKQGRFDDARVALNQAIQLHPELVLGYVALAQSFMQQGDDQKALEPLLKARATLPQDATLEYYFGLVSLRLGHNADAEAALKNSARLRPEVVEPHYQLGKLYLASNRLPEAQSEFERVIALEPANSNAHYQLSKIYARLGDTQKATQMAAETKDLMQTQREAALRLQKSRLNEFQSPTANK
jgi:tetratricopeptide (TPR) repeat protein